VTTQQCTSIKIGSFAVGNRLLSDDERTVQSSPNRAKLH